MRQCWYCVCGLLIPVAVLWLERPAVVPAASPSSSFPHGIAASEADENTDSKQARESLLERTRSGKVTGSSERGVKLFHKAGCVSCHSVKPGQDDSSAPNLARIGERRSLASIARKVLFPSSDIASGWQQVTVTMKDGRTVIGVLKNSSADDPLIISRGGKSVEVAQADIESFARETTSEMPEGLLDGWSTRDAMDLFQYLASLKHK